MLNDRTSFSRDCAGKIIFNCAAGRAVSRVIDPSTFKVASGVEDHNTPIIVDVSSTPLHDIDDFKACFVGGIGINDATLPKVQKATSICPSPPKCCQYRANIPVSINLP